MTRLGKLILVAGPSGCGKSSLIRKLLEEHPRVAFPVSATTREPRPGEEHGVHYHFMVKNDFMDHQEKGDFLETAEVYGQYYGTLKHTVLGGIDQGQCLLKDIDVQGAMSIMEALTPEILATIFISPPSLDILKRRLEERKTESTKQLDMRLKEAQFELNEAWRFNYRLINDEFNTCYKKFDELIQRICPNL